MKPVLSKKFHSVYRFWGLCFVQMMGYAGLFRQHIHVFRGHDLVGTEAMAFGILCLSFAVTLVLWDYLSKLRGQEI